MKMFYVFNSQGEGNVVYREGDDLVEGIENEEGIWQDVGIDFGVNVKFKKISRYDCFDGVGRIVYDDNLWSEGEVLDEVNELDEYWM